jgi:cytochrome c oxidase assembly protein Cox11
MGRWENNHFAEDDGFSSKRNYVKIAKYALVTGFVIVAVVVLSVYIPRSGLYVEIIERSEVMGTMQTVTVRVSNNNFDILNDVSVQFDDQGQIQQIGNMGPFSSVMITPPGIGELNFSKVTVTAGEGNIQVIKSR